MKITLITATYNSAATIEQTILSVLSQQNVDIEYVIIDGGSTDGTLGIVDKYKERIAKIVSEKDSGIYDAMNKGIRLATGDIIGIINSDDFYFDENIISEVHSALCKENIDACYGDIIYVDKLDYKKTVRIWKSGNFNAAKINTGWIPPHPAFFCKRNVYEKIGLYRTDMKLAADYEFMLRCLKVHKINISYINKPFVYMRNEGASSKNLKNRIAGWRELKASWLLNNLQTPPFFIFRRILSKIPQFFN